MPPSTDIRLLVTRRDAPPVSAALAAVIREIAEEEGIPLDRALLTHRSPQAVAAEAASEWNSLLISARADRGPQWDVMGQRYVVDERSDLFYDPRPILPDPTPPPLPPAEPQRPMPNGIVHPEMPMLNHSHSFRDSPVNHVSGGLQFSPPVDASPGGRFETTPRRSMRNGPIGRDG